MSSYEVEQWSRPKPMPDEGIVMPTPSWPDFKHYFMNIDSRIWEMTQAERETWKLDILFDWRAYRPVLYWNGTGAFHKQLRDMNRMGGGLIIIPGGMGTGKSIIANTLLKMWNVLKKNKDPSHIFWSKNKVRAKIKETAPNTAHSIDEDMRSTGYGAGNLEIHLKNLFESIRKTGKLVVDVGVNVQPRQLGRAVGLQILPMGFNRRFQANRFVVCNWKGKPLWLAMTQRYYYPNEPVFYEGELGCFGEYAARALEFSSTMSGVFAGTSAELELKWRTQLVKHCDANWKGVNLSMDALMFEAIQIEIPQESIASVKRVCASAKLLLRKDKRDKAKKIEVKITEKGWLGFRKVLRYLALKKGASERDAEALSLYYVPRSPKWSYADVTKEMGLSILADSISKQILKWKKEFRTKEIGDLGERFVASQLDSLDPVWGGGGDEVPDIQIGDWVFNIKTTLSDSIRKHEPTTPENKWDNAHVILLLPRLLECRLYPITGEHTMLNGRKGHLVAIDTLARTIKEMMRGGEQ